MTPRRPDRRGLAIIPALVCLLLVTLLSGLLLRQVTTRRATARSEERRMQAEWLAESGLARASARMAAEHGYRGETWEVAPEALGGGAGVVRITVDAGDREGRSARDRFLIRVEADYPRDDVRRARASKTLTIDLGPETPGGP
jgi:hypothetical protein